MQWRNGVLDEDSWNAYKQVIPTVMLGSPRARRWWRDFGRPQFHPEFCVLVEKLMAENPDTNLLKQVLDIA